MGIGKRIKHLREDMGYTQVEFAKILHIQPKVLSHYETERNIAPPEVLIQISTHCNISLDFLITGKKNHIHTISDPALFQLFLKLNQLEKKKLEKIRWAIEAFLEKEK